MSYKTILVQADWADAPPSCTAVAAQIALVEDAHLVGVAMSGVEQVIYHCNAAAPGVVELPADLTALTARADQALAAFIRNAERHGVNSYETRRIDGAPDLELIMHARYADLLVLRQHDPEHPNSGLPADFAESVVIGSGRPALVLPYVDTGKTLGSTVLVAWKETAEAARAVSAALPLLQQASSVHVATWGVQDAPQVASGLDIASFLRAHGVHARFHHEREAGSDVGDLIQSLAADVSADLLVMGCYGHARARELVLGGASRTLLRSMALPVLMAH